MAGQGRDTLVLLGHGSSKHLGSSASVRRHAELLARRGGYREVRVAFLKEAPFIDTCLDALPCGRAVVVPDFLAEGYFTRQVIPAKLGLAQRRGNVVCCPPVGTHPVMAELVAGAAEEAAAGWRPEQTSLLVVGHGSRKNPCSKQTLLHHLQEVRRRGSWAQVRDLWLEEAPEVGAWSRLAQQRRVVVVPFLLNDGQHGGWDIPAELGLEKGTRVHGATHRLDGHQLRISPALGTSPAFADAIASLASLWAGNPGR